MYDKIDDLFLSIIYDIQQKIDDYIFKCLEKCGYTSEYIFNNYRKFKIIAEKNNTVRTYFHKDKKLFTIYESRNINCSEGETYSTEYTVKLFAKFYNEDGES